MKWNLPKVSELVKHERNHKNTLWSACFTIEFESFISVEYPTTFFPAQPVYFNGLDVVFSYYCPILDFDIL